MHAEDRDWFSAEYEEELARLFRRRFLWLSLTYVAWEVFWVALTLTSWVAASEALNLLASDRWPSGMPRPDGNTILALDSIARLHPVTVTLLTLLVAGIAAWFGFVRRKRVHDRLQLIGEATHMIALVGAAQWLLDIGLSWNAPDDFNPIASVCFWHLTACLFLPWTPRQSLRPILPLAALYLASSVVLTLKMLHGADAEGSGWGPWLRVLGSTLALPFGLAPGLLLCWWRLRRHGSRFKTRRFREAFITLRRELSDARALHESVFPANDAAGPIPFRVAYRPAQDLGGDFPATWIRPDDARMVILVDVFGHGIRAALAVQRLAGEIERLRLERPMAEPLDIMDGLQRYCEIVLSRHQSFATAYCAKLDAAKGSVSVVNAGHPPPFLRRASGEVVAIHSTGALLGIGGHGGFVVEELPLLEGDVLIGYTDGVIEATNPLGQPLGESHLRGTVAKHGAREDAPDHIATIVDNWTRGRRDDDVLAVMAGPVHVGAS